MGGGWPLAKRIDGGESTVGRHRQRRNSQSEVRMQYPRYFMPRNAKSMDRDRDTDSGRENKFVTSIDIRPAMNGGFYSEIDDEQQQQQQIYDVHRARPGTVIPEPNENEAIYGVVPMNRSNNVRIVLRERDSQDERIRSGGMRQGSIVHINSEKNTVPYCCTGKNTKSNEIRIVVNHRYGYTRECKGSL